MEGGAIVHLRLNIPGTGTTLGDATNSTGAGSCQFHAGRILLSDIPSLQSPRGDGLDQDWGEHFTAPDVIMNVLITSVNNGCE